MHAGAFVYCAFHGVLAAVLDQLAEFVFVVGHFELHAAHQAGSLGSDGRPGQLRGCWLLGGRFDRCVDGGEGRG